VGAAWWGEWAYAATLIPEVPAVSVRECFLGVTADYRDKRHGSRLFNSLLGRARVSESIARIIGTPNSDFTRGMLDRRGFTPERILYMGRPVEYWHLNVQDNQ